MQDAVLRLLRHWPVDRSVAYQRKVSCTCSKVATAPVNFHVKMQVPFASSPKIQVPGPDFEMLQLVLRDLSSKVPIFVCLKQNHLIWKFGTSDSPQPTTRSGLHLPHSETEAPLSPEVQLGETLHLQRDKNLWKQISDKFSLLINQSLDYKCLWRT